MTRGNRYSQLQKRFRIAISFRLRRLAKRKRKNALEISLLIFKWAKMSTLRFLWKRKLSMPMKIHNGLSSGLSRWRLALSTCNIIRSLKFTSIVSYILIQFIRRRIKEFQKIRQTIETKKNQRRIHLTIPATLKKWKMLISFTNHKRYLPFFQKAREIKIRVKTDMENIETTLFIEI